MILHKDTRPTSGRLWWIDPHHPQTGRDYAICREATHHTDGSVTLGISAIWNRNELREEWRSDANERPPKM